MRPSRPWSALAPLVVAGVVALGAPAAGARVAHDPCQEAGEFLHGQPIGGLSDEELAARTDHYLVCGPRFHVPPGATHEVNHHSHECRHGWKVGGTKANIANRDHAHWDYWTHNGEWMLWNGLGKWVWRGSYAVKLLPQMHNWNLAQSWEGRVFTTCVKIAE